MIIYILLATLVTVTALPVGMPSSPLICPDKETWRPCGACDATCSGQGVFCPAICIIEGSCGCIEGHVREPKEHRCVPQNECPRIGPNIVNPPVCPDKEMWFHCGACDRSCSGEQQKCPKACLEGSCGCIEGHVRESKENRCVPENECPRIGPIIVHPPVCPDKEKWFHCGACDRSCVGEQQKCPKACREGSCGCIEGHVRESKGRCIPENECKTGVDPAELRPIPAEIRPLPAEIRPIPAEIRPLPAELRPIPAEIHPPLCPEKEMWFICGACDGSCSEQKPSCDKMCRPKGSCGCIDDHVREPKGHECIHVKNCPNTFIPLEING